MAHFAQLNENNIVTQVIVVGDENTSTKDGVENENIGIEFCKSLFGQDTNWKQTSYNGNIRKNYAGIGFIYNEILDAFIPPKPYASWLLDEDRCIWYPPVPYPTDEDRYFWNESTRTWDQQV